MTPQRIAYLAPTSGNPKAGIYGAERSLLELLRTLDRTRFTPVFFPVMDGPLHELVRREGIEVVSVAWLRGANRRRPLLALRAAWRLAQLLRAHRIELVELNLFDPLVDLGVLTVAARSAGAKLIIRSRGIAPWLSFYDKLWVSRADLIISDARISVAKWLKRRRSDLLARVRPERVAAIPSSRNLAELNAVPSDRGLMRALGVPDHGRVVAMVAAIDPVKRQELFLRAAAQVAARRPATWFLVIGAGYGRKRGNYPEMIDELARSLPCADRIIFTGYRQDAIALMKQCDVIVLTSRGEGFGSVLTEAMALGVPVVASAIGGIVEAVRDGVSGVLVDSQEPGPYADAILRLLDDAAEAGRISAGARRWAQQFDNVTVTRRLEACYRGIIAGGERSWSAAQSS